MMILVTGPQANATGNLMYFNTATPARGAHAFGMKGRFRAAEVLDFPRIKGYPANANYAPEGLGGAITHDLGLDFLFSIAGAR